MPKSLRDIVAPRAGRDLSKGETDFLDQHKVDEKDYPVKQKTAGATHVASTKPVTDPAKGHLGDKSHGMYKQANEETELDEEAHCNMSEAGQMCEVHGMTKCPNSPMDPKKKVLMDKKIVREEEMTSAEKKKEKQLKKKYDPSGMKASMKKQYGAEKGKQVYFATIRKQAMEETQVSECPSNEASDAPEVDYEGEMAKTQLKALANKAMHLHMMMKNDAQLEAWVQSKISNAKQDLDAIYDYVVFRPTKETTGPETPIAYNTVPNPSYPSDTVDVNYGSKV